jgi:hypothetical protein
MFKLKSGLAYPTLLLLSALGAARAGTLFSNLNADPLHKYNCCLGYIVEGDSPGTFFAQGFSFTPSATEDLLRIDIALSIVTEPDLVIVTLQADNGGLPGAVLQSWNVSGLPPAGTCCTLQSLTPATTITLFSASGYWLVATPGGTNTLATWNENNTGSTGRRAVQNSSGGAFSIFGANDPRGAFAVIGTGTGTETETAPEPASMALAIAGISVLLIRRARIFRS